MTHYFPRSALCIVLFPALAIAQSTSPRKEAAGTSTTKSSAPSEPDPVVAERRQLAMSLLTSLAIEARSYRDETLRARVQARTADALWDQDRENARGLFRRAWEAAEAVDTQPVANNGASGPGRLAANRPPRPRTNLRAEILKLAARRDHALGEEFLAKLTAAKNDEAARASDPSISTAELSRAEILERLRLAREFLETDNVERALQFADPALVQVITGSIQFLATLREKNPVAADQRFAALLSRAAADAASDANTVSLLTSYAFTPSMYLVVSNTGIPSSNSSAPGPAPDLPPALRTSFFRVAANILLRPFAQLDQSSAGRAGTYFIARRLFPLFQQYAPDLAPSISAQLAALGPEAAQATVSAGDRSLNRGMAPDDPAGDGLGDDLKDLLSRAQGADARDRAYCFAAMRAAETGDARAQEFVDKIEDLETRNGIRSFVDYSFIGELLRKKNADEAVRLARKSELTHALRAHVLTQAAAIVARNDRVRAMELLGDALSEARRIDANTPERAYALVALLAQFAKLDRVRAWELVGETVKSANGVRDFTGENGRTSVKLEGKFSIDMSTEMASATDLPESFATLAEGDFYQAIDAAKSFSGEAPRALVTLAVARSILDGKRGKIVR
jgi:hypothetical protein